MKECIKTIMKVGLIIMALTTMVTMNACSIINNETANDVCKALSEKYGESFVAVKIGDRFNTDSAKLYVHPADNENIIFTARINKDTGSVEDNYIEERVNYQVEDALRNAFELNGISVTSRCMVVTKDPLNVYTEEYTPQTFSEKYGFTHYTVYLVLKDGNYTASDVLNAVKSANETIGVKLVIAGYVFKEDGYSKCVSEIRSIPDISITMIEAMSPISSFDVNVEHGTCSITGDELSVKLGRS